MKRTSLKRAGLLLVLAGVLIVGMLALTGCHKKQQAEPTELYQLRNLL